jgi:NAD(P)-dependent dehydrogenase (short-subunit alcohol dehydrogenase family)
MSELTGKVALVTGASGGIGSATARLLHQRGARLVLSDLQDEGPAELMREIGDDARWCRCDVAQEADNAAMVQCALDSFGRIDIAVLNAGIEGRAGLIGETSLENFDRVMAVNVRGVFTGLSKVMPAMRQSGGGSIVILSSTAGRKGTPTFAPYVTSKHAVMGMMKCAALEGAAQNIRVNTVNPGPIDTRMMAAIEGDFSPDDPRAAHEAFVQSIPMRRYGTADEVARMIAFLASDEASYCTGNYYGVDGGQTS